MVIEGRSPDLRLMTAEGEQPFTDRAMMLLDSMNRTAQWLDEAAGTEEHEQAMAIAYQRVANPETTPSARVLAEMGDQGIPFWQLALNYSRRWHNEFLAEPLQASEFAEFQTASAASLRQQALLEDDTSESFAEYLQRFYSQYR